MRYLKTKIAAAILAASFAGALSAAEVDDAARAKLTPLIKDLASEGFDVRDKAQKELSQLGPEYIPALNEAIEKAKAEEVKANLQAALSAITERVALNPPAISIDLQNASGADVAAALSKSLSLTYETTAKPGDKGATGVTLKLEKKPYWEVIGALNAKWPIDVVDTPWDRKLQLNVSDAPTDLYKRASVQGGIAFVPVKFKKLSADEGLLMFRVAVDPRIRVIRQGALTFTDFLDQNGKNLDPLRGTVGLSITRGWVTTYPIRVRFPDLPPKTISSLKGEMKFFAMIEGETKEYDDLSKIVDKPQELGKFKIKITKAEAPKGKPSISYVNEGPQLPPGAPRTDTVDGEFQITDANGQYVTTLQVTPNGGGGGGMNWGNNGTFVEPLKGKFLAPKTVKEVTVPFAIKDVPVEEDK